MNKKEVTKIGNNAIAGFIFLVVLSSFVSAGIGIKWDRESSVVPDQTKTCLTYSVYNPWPQDAYAQVGLSEELQGIVLDLESKPKYIPAETSSSEAIPVEFCFKTPKLFERDCLLFNKLICELDCEGEETQVYDGEVEIIEVPGDAKLGGTGGSATTMSVSAPLKIAVQCVTYGRNYSLIYIVLGLIAALLLTMNVLRDKKKSNKKKK